MARVKFVDESTHGKRAEAWTLHVAEERLTVRELIRRRVFQETAEYNARSTVASHALVQPLRSEAALTGDRPSTPPRVDPERQFHVALERFARNGFLILVGDRQVEQLDEEIDLALDTEAVFLKLVPLVGG
ncbi:hypothetical protein ACIOWI_35760 [Streptomyces sp. NPDC087659]|uniref:hypothetical protein n=1 Tax=Streptomyces sp. NPDC087659 TaxID=3365801 RepID=UPI003823A374